MPSKSKGVRIEQRGNLEKKLNLRLDTLMQKGISKEKAQKDPLVKEIKAKIRETNVRIAAFEKHEQLTGQLTQAKELKLTEEATKKTAAEVSSEATPAEAKPKKKAAGEAKKKAAGADGEEPKKKPRKKKEEAAGE
jgi:hypothetical protein